MGSHQPSLIQCLPSLPHCLHCRMPHICGPHSSLPNCRYHDRKKVEDPDTTWVPIPIHKVQELTSSPWENSSNDGQNTYKGGSYPSNGSHYPSNTSHYPSGGSQYPSNGGQHPSGGGQYPSGVGQYHPFNGSQDLNNKGATNIPIKLDSPSLILKAKEKTATDDDLFPRKRKSEFTK